MSVLLDYIREKPDCLTGKGADKLTIESAEKQLQLKFSKEYKELLEKFSFLLIDSHEIMGFSKTDRLNVVVNTLSSRKKYSDFPMSLYVIEDIGIDRILILQGTSGEVYEYVPGLVPKRIFSSIGDYIIHDND